MEWSLIVPPIGIVVGIGVLFWLFWSKRGAVSRVSSRNMSLDKAITPPKVNRPVRDFGSVPQRRIAGPILAFFQALWAWAVASVVSIGQKVRRKKTSQTQTPVQGTEKETGDLGVSGVISDSSTQEHRIGHREDSQETHGQSRQMRERPMISDEITLPEKRRESDRYEQILVERIALNPRDIEAYERLGEYYIKNESLNDAKECFKQVLRLSPMSRRAKIRMRRIEKLLAERGRRDA